jgi:ferredoxin
MIKVNADKCDACGTCVGVCPSDALVLEETITVNSTECSGCLICVQICPFGALSAASPDTHQSKGSVS